MSSSGDRKLQLGVAGLGRAFSVMLPTLTGDPRVVLVAAADSRAEARRQFETDFSGKAYATVEELCADPAVEIVYVATPHQFHAQHALLAARHGKHLLVEKPMALTLEECATMIDAAARARVHLIVGHSHSFDAPVRRMRELVASGAFGAVRMINAINYTDYLYRPRRPEELDTAQGGGAVFNQAAHQIDVVRLIGGGLVTSVRAMTGAWDRERPTEGAYAALLTFAGGAFASLTYSGYGRFNSDEFQGWIGEMGERKSPNAGTIARSGSPMRRRRPRSRPRAIMAAPNFVRPRGAGRAPAFRHADRQLRARRSARAARWRHDLSRRHQPARRDTAADGAARRSHRRTVSRHRARRAVRCMTAPGPWRRWKSCWRFCGPAREGRDVTLNHQVGLP